MGLGIPIIDSVTKIIDKLIPDPAQKAMVQLELAKLDLQAITAQTEVNKVEAGHRSIFVAGWRPFVGWVSGIGLAYGVLLQPLMSWLARVVFDYTGTFPMFDDALLIYALGGMLGLGAMRSYDKAQGTSNDVLPLTKAAADAITTAPEKPKRKKILGLFSGPAPEKTPWE